MKRQPVKRTTANSQGLFKKCVVCTLVFGLAAHAYCYVNMMLSHDALFSLFRQDLDGQLQLGRFMHIPYMALRGSITAPALIGCFSLMFLCFAAYLTIKLLDIRDTLFIALTCGIMATNVTLTFTNATYLHESDMYILALLLACAAVWVCCSWKNGWVFAAVLLAVSMGFYQAYLSVALMLFVMMVIGRVLDGVSCKALLSTILPMLGAVVLAFVVYSSIVFATTSSSGLGLSSEYNGLESVGDFSSISIPVLLAKTWLFPLTFLLNPSGLYPEFMAVLNAMLSIAIVFFLGWLAWKGHLSRGSIAILVALLLAIPFAANAIYFIAKGAVHSLMIYSFFYWYLFAIQLLQRLVRTLKWKGVLPHISDVLQHVTATDLLLTLFSGAVSMTCACAVLFGIVFANQAYFTKHLQFEATELVMNRVINRVEQLDGYVPGETPVYFVGSLSKSPLFKERKGFDGVQGTGFWSQSAITYDEISYFEEVLGYPINLVSDSQAAEILSTDTINHLGVFPASNSVNMIDSVVVVRLSEDLQS